MGLRPSPHAGTIMAKNPQTSSGLGMPDVRMRRPGHMLGPISSRKFTLTLAALSFVLSNLAVWPSVSFAQAADPPPVPPITGSFDEKEAQSIDRMLMCPVCPAESIDQAQVELAQQMREQVRLLLAQGKSREEVLDYFVQRYGKQVLAAPPFAGISLLAWVVPIGSVLLGIGAGFVILRSMSRNRGANTVLDAEEELEPYMEAVDRGLSLEEHRRGIEEARPGGTRDVPASEEHNG